MDLLGKKARSAAAKDAILLPIFSVGNVNLAFGEFQRLENQLLGDDRKIEDDLFIYLAVSEYFESFDAAVKASEAEGARKWYTEIDNKDWKYAEPFAKITGRDKKKLELQVRLLENPQEVANEYLFEVDTNEVVVGDIPILEELLSLFPEATYSAPEFDKIRGEAISRLAHSLTVKFSDGLKRLKRPDDVLQAYDAYLSHLRLYADKPKRKRLSDLYKPKDKFIGSITNGIHERSSGARRVNLQPNDISVANLPSGSPVIVRNVSSSASNFKVPVGGIKTVAGYLRQRNAGIADGKQLFIRGSVSKAHGYSIFDSRDPIGYTASFKVGGVRFSPYQNSRAVIMDNGHVSPGIYFSANDASTLKAKIKHLGAIWDKYDTIVE